MKIYSKLIAILLVTILTAACSDSFFQLEPSTSVSSEKLYKSASDFNIAVIGCYAKLQGQTGFYTECCEYRSDNIYLSAPTAGTQDRYDIDQFVETAANGILSDYWANFNNGVFRCNLVLEQIDNADIDGKLKKQYKGEAMFIRAYTYFNMYRVWGGVPTTRVPVTVSEALKIGRSSEEQMFNLIAGDLKQIVDEELLPASYSGNDIGRITLGAAQALLGKVYLTFHKWEEAKNVLSQVIGKYSLTAHPGDVFDVNNKNNRETLFAVKFNKSVVGEGHGYWFSISNTSEYLTGMAPELIAAYPAGDLRKELIKLVSPESGVYVVKKFSDVRDATTRNVGNDQIILRYADVLLMYAEALNEAAYSNSQTSPALTSLNEVRTRAGLATLNISTLPDKESFRRAIMEERRLEFPLEGHRWFDLVRMGYAKEAMAAVGHDIADYQLLFPIPKTELERINDKSLLWQNPGYERN